MVTATLTRELEARHDDLPRSADTARWRAAAAAEFAAAGLPTPRRENWRYTDLKPIAEGSFELFPPVPDGRTVERVAELLRHVGLNAGGPRLVLIDGHYAPGLEVGAADSRFELGSLSEHWTSFERRYPATIATADHPLATLNLALARQGAWLCVPAGVKLTTPVEIVLAAGGAPSLAPQPRVVIELGEDAELTVVQHFIDVGAPASWVNCVTQIDQGPRSRLALYRLQQHGPGQAHTSLLSAELAAHAELGVGYVDLGGALVRNDVAVRLREPGATVELFGLFLAAAGQHVDDHTRIDHVGPETRSDEAFRGIVGSRGRGVFNGKVVVHRDAQRTDARQSNDNLLLGEHAEIDTKPELEIYADDVKCSHGSTVGELDAEQLFYLRSRGLGEAAARELLTTAFAATVLERIREPTLREALGRRVAERLRHLTEHRP
jgi:Fe-S cluster assembly protein SufD